jgi:hypothetical protein
VKLPKSKSGPLPQTPCGACAAQLANDRAAAELARTAYQPDPDKLPPDLYALAWLLGWCAGAESDGKVLLCSDHARDLAHIRKELGKRLHAVPLSPGGSS